MNTLVLFVLFASFACSTLATVSSTSYQLCTTKYGTSSKNPVPSSTYSLALTFHPTLKITSTPLTTVTPAPKTTVLTDTQIVRASVAYTTKASTLTSTKTDTSTVIQTSTSTFTTDTTTTTIVSQSTSTVPPPAKFTYPSPVPSPSTNKHAVIEAVLPKGGNYPPALEPRGGSKPSGISSCQMSPLDTPICYPAHYPTSVLCGELIEVFSTSTIVETASTTSTVSASQSTVTSTTTTTSTSTSSYAASISTIVTKTMTATSVITSPTTTTTTVTQTATVTPATATYYAACSPQNVIAAPQGYYFVQYQYTPATKQASVQTPDNNAYDCCVACITDPYCKVAEFSPNECSLDYGDYETNCSGGEIVIVHLSDQGTSSLGSLSAGNCGGGFIFTYDN